MPDRVEGVIEGSGVVAADVTVTLAGATRVERVRREFVLRADDGRRLEADASAADVVTAAPERSRGAWREVQTSELGSALTGVSAGPHILVELEARVVRGGERAVVEGELSAPSAVAGDGYREGGPADRPWRMIATRLATGRPAPAPRPASGQTPRRRPVRVDRFAGVRLAIGLAFAGLAVALVVLPAVPPTPSLAFLHVAWVITCLGLSALFLERGRSVPCALPGPPRLSVLPSFITLSHRSRDTTPNGLRTPFVFVGLFLIHGFLAPDAVADLGVRIAARFTSAEAGALASGALDYVAGALSIGLVLAIAGARLWDARADLAVAREILRAGPGRPDAWGAWEGRASADVTLRSLAITHEHQGAGRSRSRWARMEGSTPRDCELVLDTEEGSLRVRLLDATAGSVEREAGEGHGWRERVSAGASVRVVGTVRRSDDHLELATSGPGTVLLFASATGTPRLELFGRVAARFGAIVIGAVGLALAALAAALTSAL